MANLLFCAWIPKIMGLFWHMLIKNEEKNQIFIPFGLKEICFRRHLGGISLEIT